MAGPVVLINGTLVSVPSLTTVTDDARASGVLTAAAGSTAAQVLAPVAGSTAVQMSVPDGHSASQFYLSGTFSAGSQVFFEGSSDGSDGSWFSLNSRRNTDPSTNDESSLLDASPFGGASPQGAGSSNWRGNIAAVRFIRVRCGTYFPGDSISVVITTGHGSGATFPNAPAPLSADNFKAGSLLAPGDTVLVSASGSGSWSSYMLGNFTGTVFFEGSVDGVTFNKINGAVQGVGTLQTQLTGTGTANQSLQVRGGSGGLKNLRLRAGADFVGTFTGTLRAGAGTGGVFLTAPVPIAGLSNGSQTSRQTVGLAAVRLDSGALAARTSVEVKYHANGAGNNAFVYVGFSNAVTAGTGRELSPGESWTLDVTPATQIWAIATAAAQPVQITEIG